MAVFFEEPGLKGRPRIVCFGRLSWAYPWVWGGMQKKIARKAFCGLAPETMCYWLHKPFTKSICGLAQGAGSEDTFLVGFRVCCIEICNPVVGNRITGWGKELSSVGLWAQFYGKGDIQGTCNTHATHMQHTCNTHATHMQHTCNTIPVTSIFTKFFR